MQYPYPCMSGKRISNMEIEITFWWYHVRMIFYCRHNLTKRETDDHLPSSACSLETIGIQRNTVCSWMGRSHQWRRTQFTLYYVIMKPLKYRRHTKPTWYHLFKIERARADLRDIIENCLGCYARKRKKMSPEDWRELYWVVYAMFIGHDAGILDKIKKNLEALNNISSAERSSPVEKEALKNWIEGIQKIVEKCFEK